jgi:hypothetical protein
MQTSIYKGNTHNLVATQKFRIVQKDATWSPKQTWF